MGAVLGAVVAPIASYLLSVLGFIGVAFYAIFRLKSTHIIREKIWSSFVGDKDFNDEKLHIFSNEQLDLSRFRVIYGVSAGSISDLHRLLGWMSTHGLTPIDVKRAREWIDPSKDEPLETPKRKFAFAWLAVFVALIVCLAGTSPAIASNQALLKMRVSETWYLSDGRSAHSIRGRWHMDHETCVKGLVPDTSVTHLTNVETKLLCDAMGNGQLETFVKDTVQSQRRLFGLIGLTIVFFAIGVFRKLDSAGHAKRLANKLSTEPFEILPEASELQEG